MECIANKLAAAEMRHAGNRNLLPHIREQVLLAMNMQTAEDSFDCCDMAHVLHPLLSSRLACA